MNKPKRKSDIDALIEEMKSQYSAIEILYCGSLQAKEIDANLKIKIKNFLENARSILDYCAHDIADTQGLVVSKTYFPIVGKEKNKDSFEGCIGSNLPGIKEKNEQVYDYLESLQPYHPQYLWLGDFVEVNNDTKHSQLTPQTKTETKVINIQHGGTGMTLSGGASISIGRGASVSLGGATIQSGQIISPDSSLILGDPRLNVRKEIWVDFKFNNSISALSLLKKIKENTPNIIEEIYKIL